MISAITGKINQLSQSSVVIQTASGLGYEVRLKSGHLHQLRVGEEISLSCHLVVREDALELFGFPNEREKSLFLRFLAVSGVGPKTALHLLSLGSVEEIEAAISRGDTSYLTNVSGIGRKTAERIVVELKEKITSQPEAGQPGDVLSEVIDALVSLGYKRDKAREAVRGLEVKDKTTEVLLREVLRQM